MATMKSTNPLRQKNRIFLWLLLLVAVGFYFLTLVRMGEQSHDKQPAPATQLTR